MDGGKLGGVKGSDILRLFVLRARALSLYREALRTARKAPPDGRDELAQQMRLEMEKHRREKDPQAIRFLLSEGFHRLKELQAMLGLQGHQ